MPILRLLIFLLAFPACPLVSILLAASPAAGAPAQALVPIPAISTEDALNRLGVNTHLNGLSQSDPWDTDATHVGAELKYLGVRLDRDWAHGVGEGTTWAAVQKAWGPWGRFWTSIDETSPAGQQADLADEEQIFDAHPGLIYAMGGPNEEDDAYPQGLGATLPDAARVQAMLYAWAHGGGREIPVSQMEFGAGWSAANGWQGDYNPQNTGIHQNYTPGPADFGAAHVYLHQPGQRPADVLAQLRALARQTTPGKPVAMTEFGAYRSAAMSAADYGQELVMGALDSIAAGDAAFLIYGLQDSEPENTYGLFAYPGRVPHPAATDLHVLTTLLQSPRGQYGPGMHPTFAPGRPAAAFSNPAISRLVMQKPTGEFVIAEWSEQVMDGREHAETDTLRFAHPVSLLRVYDVERGLAPVATYHNTAQLRLDMQPGDTYLVGISAGRP